MKWWEANNQNSIIVSDWSIIVSVYPTCSHLATHTPYLFIHKAKYFKQLACDHNSLIINRTFTSSWTVVQISSLFCAIMMLYWPHNHPTPTHCKRSLSPVALPFCVSRQRSDPGIYIIYPNPQSSEKNTPYHTPKSHNHSSQNCHNNPKNTPNQT